MEQYIIKTWKLWPKINRTYHFDSNEGRSVYVSQKLRMQNTLYNFVWTRLPQRVVF